MRETWARRLALLSTALLLAIAAALTGWRNREQAPSRVQLQSPSVDAEGPRQATALGQRGAAVYRDQGCRSCHALAGQGNASHPLDGIGARLDADEIRQWITADPAIASRLSARVRQRKAVYAALSDDELAALVAYLAAGYHAG